MVVVVVLASSSEKKYITNQVFHDTDSTHTGVTKRRVKNKNFEDLKSLGMDYPCHTQKMYVVVYCDDKYKRREILFSFEKIGFILRYPM